MRAPFVNLKSNQGEKAGLNPPGRQPDLPAAKIKKQTKKHGIRRFSLVCK